MVDVMSHGGDAGGDPPHHGSSYIPVQCQSCKYYNYYLLFYFKRLICFLLTEILNFVFINVVQPKRKEYQEEWSYNNCSKQTGVDRWRLSLNGMRGHYLLLGTTTNWCPDLSHLTSNTMWPPTTKIGMNLKFVSKSIY